MKNILHKWGWVLSSEQSWKYHTPCFQIMLQSSGNENSMMLAEKQTHRTMEQNWEPRNELTDIQTINFQQRSKEHTVDTG